MLADPRTTGLHGADADATYDRPGCSATVERGNRGHAGDSTAVRGLAIRASGKCCVLVPVS